MKWIVGIDEVGRGPLAGPVCVGVFCCDKKSLTALLKHAPCKITDSKKMKVNNRAQIVEYIKNITKNNSIKKSLTIACAVGYSSAAYIDKHGLTKAIQTAMLKALKKLPATYSDTYLLDGGLKLPPIYNHQTTIIKGDLKEPVISLASIVAKQSRDGCMHRLAKKYPQYGFDKHVGYGTKSHYNAIKTHKPIKNVHRELFLRKFNND